MVRQRTVQHEQLYTALESVLLLPGDDGYDVRLAEDIWDIVLGWLDSLK